MADAFETTLDELTTWPWWLGLLLIIFGLGVLSLGWVKSRDGSDAEHNRATLRGFNAPGWLVLVLAGVVIVLMGFAAVAPNDTEPDEVESDTPVRESEPALTECEPEAWAQAARTYIEANGLSITWVDDDNDCLHNEYERNSTGTPLNRPDDRSPLPSFREQFLEGLLLPSDS